MGHYNCCGQCDDDSYTNYCCFCDCQCMLIIFCVSSASASAANIVIIVQPPNVVNHTNSRHCFAEWNVGGKIRGATRFFFGTWVSWTICGGWKPGRKIVWCSQCGNVCGNLVENFEAWDAVKNSTFAHTNFHTISTQVSTLVSTPVLGSLFCRVWACILACTRMRIPL